MEEIKRASLSKVIISESLLGRVRKEEEKLIGATKCVMLEVSMEGLSTPDVFEKEIPG